MASPPLGAPLFAANKPGRPIQQRFLPGVDLAGVNAKPARQLGDRALLPHCRQRHFRFELRTVPLPCNRHVSPSANRPSQGGTLS
jgi:hypothetical protein